MYSFCAEFCADDGTDIKFGTFLLLFVFCGLFLWGSFFYFVSVSAAAARREDCHGDCGSDYRGGRRGSRRGRTLFSMHPQTWVVEMESIAKHF